jgi:hypothetical protein
VGRCLLQGFTHLFCWWKHLVIGRCTLLLVSLPLRSSCLWLSSGHTGNLSHEKNTCDFCAVLIDWPPIDVRHLFGAGLFCMRVVTLLIMSSYPACCYFFSGWWVWSIISRVPYIGRIWIVYCREFGLLSAVWLKSDDSDLVNVTVLWICYSIVTSICYSVVHFSSSQSHDQKRMICIDRSSTFVKRTIWIWSSTFVEPRSISGGIRLPATLYGKPCAAPALYYRMKKRVRIRCRDNGRLRITSLQRSLRSWDTKVATDDKVQTHLVMRFRTELVCVYIWFRSQLWVNVCVYVWYRDCVHYVVIIFRWTSIYDNGE